MEWPDLSGYTPMGVALFIILVLALVLLWVVRLVVTGKLIPRTQHDETVAWWKDAATESRRLVNELVDQNSILMEGARTTTDVLKKAGGEHVGS